jgi:sulfur-oxidizing protein SoxX
MHGSRRSPAKSSVEIACALLIMTSAVSAQELRPFRIENGGIAASLTGKSGDAARGRAIVADRQKGLCLLCHTGPFPEERFQGDLAPSLSGAGLRLSEGELRLRMVDGTKVNPATIMPAYYRIADLNRVAPTFRGKPVLDASEIEDVVAFLLTLREESK